MNEIIRWYNDESGVSTIEYALIGAMIAVVIAAAVVEVGTGTLALFTRACSAVKDAIVGGNC